MESKILIKPTEKQYTALQQAFDYFNEKLFKDSLPQVMLTLNRERNTFGYYVPSIWTDDNGVEQWGEIALNPDYILKDGERTDKEVYATLVHEMCHLWQEYDGSAPRRCYHNKDFAEKMERVGLITSSDGTPDGKRTGQRVTHYIVEGGPFDMAFQEMPDELLIPCHTLFALKGESKKKIKKARAKSVTYFCPKCGATVKGKEDTNVICGDCMEKMLVKTGRDKQKLYWPVQKARGRKKSLATLAETEKEP